MTDQEEVDHHLELGKAISSIGRIAMALPQVGKRSELKLMQEEIYKQITLAREHARAMEKEIISLKYEWPNDRFKRVKGVKRG
jgi:hypothetical protein